MVNGINIAAAFEAQVKKTPNNIALVDGNKIKKYNELNTLANQLAHYLVKQGAKIGDRIGVFIEPSYQAIIAIIAILKLGACYVPIDPSYPKQRVQHILNNSEVKFVITQNQFASEQHIPDTFIKIIIDTNLSEWQEILKQNTENLTKKISAKSLAYVIYTSGSTGVPKGVLIPHHNILSLFEACKTHFDFSETDVWLQLHSIAFDMSVWEIWGALLLGGKLIIVSEKLRRSVEELHQLICEQKVTVLNQTPQAFLRFMSTDEQYALPKNLKRPCENLHWIILGGEKLNISSIKPWLNRYGDHQAKIINMYGITEITIHATFKHIKYNDLLSNINSPIGEMLPGMLGYVLDKNKNQVAHNKIGELYISGDRLALGYLNLPEITQERFIDNPFGSGKLYKSGDLVRNLGNNQYEYLERSDHQVKIRGYRIELDEIAKQLQTNEKIKQALVTVYNPSADSQQLVAYIILNVQIENHSSAYFDNYLRDKLPDYMIPSAFVIIEEIPMTSHGKIDKTKLPPPTREQYATATEYVSPITKIEIQLEKIWGEILGIDKISMTDNFFSLGGSSLSLVNLKLKIAEMFNTELSFSVLFSNQNFSAMASLIEQTSKDAARSSANVLKHREQLNNIPLSLLQESLWLAIMLKNQLLAYQIPLAFYIQGPLDIDVLERAINQVIKRHNVLRTRFTITDYMPTQNIVPTIKLKIGMHQIKRKKNKKLRTSLREQLKILARTTSDLESGKLISVTAMQLEPEINVLLFNISHLVFDLGSKAIFFKELSECYRSMISGCPAKLEPINFDYADYCIKQREDFTAEKIDQLTSYWKKQLSDVPSYINLPYDYQPAASKEKRGSRQFFHLSKESLAKLKTQAMEANVTLFMLVLSIFSLLINRYSKQTDFIIGSPIQNRHYQGLENLIGYFTNTLPFRCQLDDIISVGEYLKKIKQICLDAYEHQDLPATRLVELLQKKDATQTEYLQILLVVLPEFENLFKADNCHIKEFLIDTETVKFDLSLFFQETKQGVIAYFEYDINLFNRETIKLLITHFKNLINQFTDSLNKSLSEIHLLDQAEQTDIINQSRSSYTKLPDVNNIMDWVNRSVRQFPNSIAVTFDSYQLSYKLLDKLSDALANQLKNYHCQFQDFVALLLERSFDIVIAIIACHKIGACYVPLDTEIPKKRLDYMIDNAQIKFVIIHENLQELVADLDLAVIKMKPNNLEVSTAIEKPLSMSPTLNDSAYMIYTSGSTGQPKGVLLPHSTLVNLINWQIKQSPGQYRIALFSSFNFDVATQAIFFSLISGSQLFILTDQTRKDPNLLIQYIAAQQINLIMMPPAMLHLIALTDLEKTNLVSLKQIIVAGEALVITNEIKRFFKKHPHCKLINQYGPSETHVITSYELNTNPDSWPAKPSIGTAIDNAELYVLDEHLHPVPNAMPGELYAGGLMLAKGYVSQDDLTAERFLKNPYDVNSIIYKTGDIVKRTFDGNIEYLGRIDNQIKIRGYRIELGEIEAQLELLDEVKSAAVIIASTPHLQDYIIAYVTAKELKQIEENQLQAKLATSLPSYMLPHRIIVIDDMPMTITGKKNRKALPEIDIHISREKTFAAAETETQKKILLLWKDLFQIQNISIDDNLYQLGGNSLLAAKIVLTINQMFKTTIALHVFLANPTIRQLADIVDNNFSQLKQSEVSVDFAKDLILSQSIQPLTPKAVTSKFIHGIFITGVTGFLGVYLLNQYHKNTNAQLICLVRAKTQIEAKIKFTEILEYFGFNDLIQSNRITLVCGDLSLPNLGLAPDDFATVCHRVDMIIHNGYWVNHIYDYQKLRNTNVLSIIEILKIASNIKSKSIHFISTIAAISDHAADGSALEQFPINQLTNQCGYVQTKWVAESLLSQAKDRGFAVTIYRTSHIGADSQTGVIAYQQHHISKFIKGCIQLRIAPQNFGKVDSLPVDYVAQIIVAISLFTDAVNQVFNIAATDKINWNTIFKSIQRLGFPLRFVAKKKWHEALSTMTESNELYPLVPLYLATPIETEQEDAEIIMTNTKTLLDKLQLSFTIDNTLFYQKYLKFLQDWFNN